MSIPTEYLNIQFISQKGIQHDFGVHLIHAGEIDALALTILTQEL